MINFATIGTSWITEEFITTGQTFADFCLYSVYSRSEEKAKAFAEKHGSKKYYTDLTAMLSDEDIDAVYSKWKKSYFKYINFEILLVRCTCQVGSWFECEP